MPTQQQEQLAIDGGQALRTTPFPPRKLFGLEEKHAAMALFDDAIAGNHGALGYGGAQEAAFTEGFCKLMGGGYADAVNSGTNAVYVALRALNLPPFSEVIVPSVSDPGGIMPVTLLNCVPVVADCAPGSYNIGAEQIAARITPRTKAIVVAHIMGYPADLDPIMALAREHNLQVVEDCAQSHMATYKGKPVGTFGDTAAFSTMSGKHFATAGQGGLVYTQSEDRYWQIRRSSDRGKPFNVEGTNGNVFASLNMNMDELHCAIGVEQLKKLPGFVETRRRAALAIAKGVADCSTFRMWSDTDDAKSSFWFIAFTLNPDAVTVDPAQYVEALKAEGLSAGLNYHGGVPSDQDWYKNKSVFGESGLPWDAAEAGNKAHAVDLPNLSATRELTFRISIHEGWTQQEIDDTIAILRKVGAAYST